MAVGGDAGVPADRAETDYGAVVKSMSLATQAAVSRTATIGPTAWTFWADSRDSEWPLRCGYARRARQRGSTNAARGLDKFAVKETRPRPFTLNGTVLRIPAMEQTKDFGYPGGTGYRPMAAVPAGKTAMYVRCRTVRRHAGRAFVALGARWPQASSFPKHWSTSNCRAFNGGGGRPPEILAALVPGNRIHSWGCRLPWTWPGH